MLGFGLINTEILCIRRHVYDNRYNNWRCFKTVINEYWLNMYIYLIVNDLHSI